MNKILLPALATLMLTLTTASVQAQEYCREYTTSVRVGHGNNQQGYGTACLQPDGAWAIQSEQAQQPLFAAPQQIVTQRVVTVQQPAYIIQERPVYVVRSHRRVYAPRPIFVRDRFYDYDRGYNRGHGYRNSRW